MHLRSKATWSEFWEIVCAFRAEHCSDGGRGGFGGAPNKNKGSIAEHKGTKITFD
jgi:hypothetical protein